MKGVREILIGSHAQPKRGASMCQNYKSKEYKIQKKYKIPKTKYKGSLA